MESLKDRLSRYRQIKLSVIGRKSGKIISNPVWFVVVGDTLYLLPVRGSDTQWYQNVLKNPQIRIEARGTEAKFRAKPQFQSDLGFALICGNYEPTTASLCLQYDSYEWLLARSGLGISTAGTSQSY